MKPHVTSLSLLTLCILGSACTGTTKRDDSPNPKAKMNQESTTSTGVVPTRAKHTGAACSALKGLPPGNTPPWFHSGDTPHKHKTPQKVISHKPTPRMPPGVQPGDLHYHRYAIIVAVHLLGTYEAKMARFYALKARLKTGARKTSCTLLMAQKKELMKLHRAAMAAMRQGTKLLRVLATNKAYASFYRLDEVYYLLGRVAANRARDARLAGTSKEAQKLTKERKRWFSQLMRKFPVSRYITGALWITALDDFETGNHKQALRRFLAISRMKSAGHKGEAHFYAAQCHLVLKEPLKGARQLLMALGTPGTAKMTSARARQRFIAVYAAKGVAADALSFIGSTPVHFTDESTIALLEALAGEYARLRQNADRKVILGLLLKKWPGHAHAATWK